MSNVERRSSHMATEVNLGESPTNPLEMLTVEQAADRLAVSRTTMFALIKDEVVPSVLVGRCRRVPAADLAAYIEELSAQQRDD